MSGIRASNVREVPLAVVDLETTGLSPRGDRIIEIAIVRRDPGEAARVVLDTLVNPERPVSATEIHGITDADVRRAPTFRDLGPLVTDALTGAVFASYNVYFDSKFIAAEFARLGIEDFPPHLCLMYMRPLLELGGRCSLADACRHHGVEHADAHVAADDALAASALWSCYLGHMEGLQVRTFRDIADRKTYKFTKSFGSLPLDMPLTSPVSVRLKSRWDGSTERAEVPKQPTAQERRAEYWEGLKAALADFEVTDAEIQYLAGKRRSLELTDEEVRSMHARAFAGFLTGVVDDHLLDNKEVELVARMADALRQLGWAPGDHPGSGRPVARREQRGWFSRFFGLE